MRWVLSLWCVFLLSAGVLAQNTLRFAVRLGKQAFAVMEFLGGRGQVLETWPH